jgi:hypothetical protein
MEEEEEEEDDDDAMVHSVISHCISFILYVIVCFP